MATKAETVEAAAEPVAATPPEQSNGVRVILTRDMILNAPEAPNELVDIPEWGGSIYIYGMTGAERDSFDRSLVEFRGKTSEVIWSNIRAKLVVRTAKDAEGKRIFSDADATLLGKKWAVPLDKAFKVAQRLSGMTDEDVEELTEALKDDPNADSGSVLH